jgi:hypothetical protein
LVADRSENMMAAKKVFISSVRRGLEEERDSLPALIQAIGHLPRRFEDFTAQPVPSRDACLAGVEDADVYLLLLGPNYGEPLFDSGLSPTEEEWTVAKRRGIPILAFRKLGVEADEQQSAFTQRVEDYVTGRFRDSFTGALDLLPKVAEKIRELAAEAGPLVWEPLDGAVVVDWVIGDDQLRYAGVGATVELHLVPLGAERLSATALERLPESIARVGRDHGLFGPGDALDLRSGEDRAFVTRGVTRDQRSAGVSVSRAHAVSAWEELPRDSLGSILDRADLASRLARLLRIGAEMAPTDVEQVALAIGFGPTQMVTEGDARDLGRRSGATMGMSDRLVRIDAEDSVPRDAITVAADEIGAELAARLVLRFRER